MKIKRVAVITATGAVVALGSGAAIAADDAPDPRKIERSILSSAAEDLGVETNELREALAAAQNEQIDQAVEDGEVTEKQAEAIKQARERSGHVLGIGPGGPGFHHHGPGGPGFGPPGIGLVGPRGGPLEDIADALGITPRRLFAQLEDGKTLAEIAKAQDKGLDDVKAAMREAASRRLDQQVEEGNLTREQADELLDHIGEHIDRLAEGRLAPPPMFRHRLPGAPRGEDGADFTIPAPRPPGIAG